MVVLRAMTAQGPIQASGPMRTLGPITAPAPTWTVESSSAVLSMAAAG